MYCDKHNWNPPDNSGFAFCPWCEQGINSNKHVWKPIKTGNTFTEYKCMNCDYKCVIHDDDEDFLNFHIYGCKNNKDL